MRLTTLAVLALGLAGCYDSIAETDWPCDHGRPCDRGYTCGDDLRCHKGDGPRVPVNEPAWDRLIPTVLPTPPEKVLPGAIAPACVPACPPLRCGPDGCGGTCGVCPGNPTARFLLGAAEPRGLAVTPTGLAVGDNVERVVLRIDPGTGQEVDRLDLPALGDVLDLAWDAGEQRLLALLRDPAGLWSLDATGPVAVVEGLEAQGLSVDGGELLTVEQGKLVRRDAKSLAVLGEATLPGTCELLAVTGGTASRLCGVEGQPGSYEVAVGDYDAAAPEAGLIATRRWSVDASVIQGLDVAAGVTWLLARGYGADSGKLVKGE